MKLNKIIFGAGLSGILYLANCSSNHTFGSRENYKGDIGKDYVSWNVFETHKGEKNVWVVKESNGVWKKYLDEDGDFILEECSNMLRNINYDLASSQDKLDFYLGEIRKIKKKDSLINKIFD